MANDGWICLYRKLLDSPIWSTSKKFDERSAWIDLLLMANHKENHIWVDSNEIVIRPGQHFTSKSKLAAKWGWDRRTVTRYLNALRDAQMVNLQCTGKWTLISIKNYQHYQGFEGNEHNRKK